MVARFFPTADVALDACSDKYFCRPGVKQEMVNANAGIPRESISKIIPESVNRLLGIKAPDGVCPALQEEALISGAGLRKKQSVVHPALGLVRVQFRWD